MILTEEEALQKWCPYAKATSEGGNAHDAGNRYSSFNGSTDYPAACQCIASRCMAWQWATTKHDKGYCGAFAGPLRG